MNNTKMLADSSLSVSVQRHRLVIVGNVFEETGAVSRTLCRIPLTDKSPEEVVEHVKQMLSALPIYTPIKLFDSEGYPADVRIYGNYWVVFKETAGRSAIRIRVDAQKLHADIPYMALRICLKYGLDETSPTYIVLCKSLQAMYDAKFRKYLRGTV
jgi:hypothetical protein